MISKRRKSFSEREVINDYPAIETERSSEVDLPEQYRRKDSMIPENYCDLYVQQFLDCDESFFEGTTRSQSQEENTVE